MFSYPQTALLFTVVGWSGRGSSVVTRSPQSRCCRASPDEHYVRMLSCELFLVGSANAVGLASVSLGGCCTMGMSLHIAVLAHRRRPRRPGDCMAGWWRAAAAYTGDAQVRSAARVPRRRTELTAVCKFGPWWWSDDRRVDPCPGRRPRGLAWAARATRRRLPKPAGKARASAPRPLGGGAPEPEASAAFGGHGRRRRANVRRGDG